MRRGKDKSLLGMSVFSCQGWTQPEAVSDDSLWDIFNAWRIAGKSKRRLLIVTFSQKHADGPMRANSWYQLVMGYSS